MLERSKSVPDMKAGSNGMETLLESACAANGGNRTTLIGSMSMERIGTSRTVGLQNLL